ncbi:DUF3718 domain-containing protein [Thalassotalea crassostreae]|uniref:DUF3718 domain-containing protein n=1 Tax=Thalassotalea crassostreae TaxID=1763536 RepID=UPI0008392A31|nr:DUF3718 domain-containing protein [Thalassotalea crassostreae]
MKNLKLALVLSLATPIAQANITLNQEVALIDVCSAAASNSRVKLIKTLEQNNLSVNAATSKIKCNNLSLIQFAKSVGADNSVKYLNKYKDSLRRNIAS